MGYLKYVRKAFQAPSEEAQEVQHKRLLQFRNEPVTIRIERPTNVARARSIGYRAKPGVIVVRQRVVRGGRQRPDIKGGRRSAHSSQRKVVRKNYQQVAEERANDVFHNCEVVNSYKVAEDGICYWFEIIMVDRNHPAVLADPQLSQIASRTGRAYRGLTMAARRSRGLINKGNGLEKNRPSLGGKHRLH